MHPVLFHIGNYTFYSFGLMAALALLVPSFGVVLPLLHHQRIRAADELAFEVIFTAGVGGFVGARVYYLIQHWATIKGDFWGHAFGGVGFTWYGGLIGGFIAVALITRWHKVPLGLMANCVAPAIALGYAIGRVGCQLAGDGDYGKVSHFHTWFLAEAYPHGTVPTPPGVHVYPTPIYEILVMVPVAYVLYRMARKAQPGWYVFGWFLVLSGIERVLIEFIRRNGILALGLTGAQWFSLASIVVGIALILITRAQPVAAAPALPTAKTATPRQQERARR
ncbi:MAG: prolipoprotein diacylglyceryl transferase [Thermoleophilia bacterium]